MLWGDPYPGGDGGAKDTKPPDAGAGAKGGEKYPGELVGDVKDSTPAAATGAANICGAGQPWYPELSALFAGEL